LPTHIVDKEQNLLFLLKQMLPDILLSIFLRTSGQDCFSSLCV